MNGACFGALGVLTLGCVDADPGTGGGGDTGDPPLPPPILEGHTIQCCYAATTEVLGGTVQSVNVCENGSGDGYSCIDPTTYDNLGNSNGTLEFPNEMSAFCQAKCTWLGGPLSALLMPWSPEPGWETEWAQASTVLGCAPTPSTNIVASNACTPDPISPDPYGSPTQLPPTNDYMGSTTDAGNSVNLTINGESVPVDATLNAHFALYDCDSAGIDGGQCSFIFTSFDLAIATQISTGGYLVTDASLSLAQVQEATVDFLPCVRAVCTGSFTLSSAGGNPLGVDLLWTQTNTSTGVVGEGGLNLSNAAGALGGLETVLGTLVLDQTSPSEGDLRLQASGSDALGGSIADIKLDLTGVVGRF